jgi:predicted esterase
MKLRQSLKKLLLPVAVMASVAASSQSTGSFDDNITFMGASRKLSVYVPTNYSSANQYRLMVCLHGLGDNCSNYRDALILSLDWKTNFPNTIFICPEASATTSDYYQPAGGEQIIEECIKYAKTNYTIDSNDIILQGFSLGGRAACRYGLDHPAEFKGLLLNTPAFQGVKNALNYYKDYSFNYANASKIPIYITHGTTDVGYTGPIDSAYYEMSLNDGMITKNEVAGMGHNIPAFSKMKDVLNFFNNPDSTDYELDIPHIYIDDVNCSDHVPVRVLLRNTGKKDINTLQFMYSVSGGSTSTYTWTGDLKPFQHTIATLNPVAAKNGKNDLLIMVGKPDGNMDVTTTTFATTVTPLKLPVFEGFEENVYPPDGWTLKAGGDYFDAWYIDSSVHKSGVASVGSANSILTGIDNSRRRTSLISPSLDLSSTSAPQLAFEVAYNYARYTPPTTTVDTTLADTLQILISTDCGASFKSIYKKGGKNLATYKAPMLNVVNSNGIVIQPADSNWRTEFVDLSNYASSTDAVLRFDYISALGGSIYIDNVSVAKKSSLKENASSSYKLFPNPASDYINISSGDAAIRRIIITDISGKEIMTIANEDAANKNISVNTSSLQNGMYIFKMISANGTETSKVLINK